MSVRVQDQTGPFPGEWPRWLTLAEVGLIFVVFTIQGASPVPEVNEPYYLGKAIHYWNPQWIPNDFFLNSADTHKVFYFTFGWTSLWLPPVAMAWVGRLITWGLLAWAWQRLSVALVPRPWFAVLTAALFVGLLERFHMAGEWIIGGVEAKGFAYVLVFLGLEALVRGRWNRTWLLLGAASAFHVLAGGWAVVAAGIAWLLAGDDRPALKSMLPALCGGFLLALPGLAPSLALTWNVDPETVCRANVIYVFERLYHHLAVTQIPLSFIGRFLGLVIVFLVLARLVPGEAAGRRLQRFTFGALAIGAVGAAINCLVDDPGRAAGWLRFYWFRLSDVAVPLAVSMLAAGGIVRLRQTRPRWGRAALAAAIVLAGLHVGAYAVKRPFPMVPMADAGRVSYGPWRQVCAWIAEPGNVPPDARFLTPIMAQTFKWYAGRAEIANWKEIPQDPHSIVEWWNRIRDLYVGRLDESGGVVCGPLAQLGAARLVQLGEKYEADYVLTRRRPRLPFEVVYENRVYVVYRLPRSPGEGSVKDETAVAKE